MESINNGGPAFPRVMPNGFVGTPEPGITKREWFATFAPEPSDEEVSTEMERDRRANEHGDSWKPSRRGVLEIRTELRYKFADAMIAGAARAPR